ncbi:MAG TPA: hypothetical protein VE172_16915 [Stackebrandtia sp.]|jgi:hypothetical protein|uniref:hypothetical protein n=1 Tax=Stackebrandtia sp. TaxID=2023065 RepID=UPI002D49A483|nr:hypothetical protein [Stackebrandtia sp.]HZE40485.1 hypothetical protein [Stackebrandtia sp.]
MNFAQKGNTMTNLKSRNDSRAVSFAFELAEIRKPTCTAVDYDEVEVMPLPYEPNLDTLHRDLHDWALDCLNSGFFDIGMYTGLCHVYNGEGEFETTIGSYLIFWDGHRERYGCDWG